MSLGLRCSGFRAGGRNDVDVRRLANIAILIALNQFLVSNRSFHNLWRDNQFRNNTINIFQGNTNVLFILLPQVAPPLKQFSTLTSLSLGKGCNGTTVYVGIMEDGSELAVKRMLIHVCEESSQNEIEILSRTDIQKSPFIVSYRYLHRDDTFIHLIVDLCEETLKEHVHSQTTEHLKEHGPRMVKENLTGLEFLHSKGILYRDVKPSKVLVDVAGKMRLADFGISGVLNEDETTVQTDAKGNRDWMPVEVMEAINKGRQCRFKKKSDIQVAGMIAFFIFTKGEHLFCLSHERMTNILEGNAVNLDKLENHQAREFVAWLIRHIINDRPYDHEALRHSFMDQVKEYEALPIIKKLLELVDKIMNSA